MSAPDQLPEKVLFIVVLYSLLLGAAVTRVMVLCMALQSVHPYPPADSLLVNIPM